ncbi:LysR family transcriptional regulator [Microbulbifer taiwanensis]|uniref:LysR family transcriptional regulator n=1 Tax=Microbulbifer taiwanensis TaxID=986746 RepID=A0ABW1YSI7_9GAMM|nr:LysR family transcriptional regulator [Microbulbifer taiwanensis]
MSNGETLESTVAPRISLEQWRCLVAVVEEGGYAQAAERLFKSQSSVSYAVQKLESVLAIKAFAIEGRKAVLTPAGEMLYRRARLLLEDASGLEIAAHKASAGWEAEIGIAVEVLFPTWLLLECLDQFGVESPQTRIELYETVIGGGPEALQQGRAELAITPHVPSGFTGELLPRPARVIPVAHPEHPLHRLERQLTLRDLRKHRHLVVRDSGSQRDTRTATVEVAQRWTVSNMATSIGAACRGYGFAWLPEEKIRAELEQGVLKPLPLRGGSERSLAMYLIFADRDSPGPGVKRLAEIIRRQMQSMCAAEGE